MDGPTSHFPPVVCTDRERSFLQTRQRRNIKAQHLAPGRAYLCAEQTVAFDAKKVLLFKIDVMPTASSYPIRPQSFPSEPQTRSLASTAWNGRCKQSVRL